MSVSSDRVTPSARQALHFPALDGLRGLAVLGVLCFHANGALPGGYLGVDLFFVLSGYLITALLLAEYAREGTLSLRAFWIRRARRLFPALLSLVPAIAIYARFFAAPGELPGLRRDTWATLLYVANWRQIWTQRSYWDLFLAPSPLEHCWSLAIEEQFYLVWPLIVLGVLALGRRSRSVLFCLTVVAAALSALTMVLLYSPNHESRVYLGTDTRATAILAGALLALRMPLTSVASSRGRPFLDGAGALALGGLSVAWWSLRGESPFLYHGGFWLTQVADLTLVACAVAGARGRVARALSFRPFTAVGAISYGLYIWHWPIDVFFTAERFAVEGWRLQILRLGLTFAIAIVSYRWLEQPIRKHGLPFGRPLYLVPAVYGAVAILVLFATSGSRASAAGATAPAIAPTTSDVDTATPPPNAPDASAPRTFNLVVFGDSTSNSLGWVMRGLQVPNLAVHLYGRDGCNMLYDTCYSERWAAHIAEAHADAVMLFLGGATEHDLDDKPWETSCDVDWSAQFEGNLQKRLREIGSTEIAVPIFVMTIPYPLGESDTAAFRRRTDCINRSIRKSVAAAGSRQVRVVEMGPELCPNGKCRRREDGEVIRPDGTHFSMTGGAKLARWTLDRMRAAMPHDADADADP